MQKIIQKKKSKERNPKRIKIPTPEVREHMVTELPQAGNMARANAELVSWHPEACWLGNLVARVPKGQ